MTKQISPSKDAFEKVRYRVPALLLVEDDDTDIMFVERYFRKRGTDVPLHIAHDGRQALELLRSGAVTAPFVILTDINMPGMSGHEMIDEIRGDDSLRTSVIFVLSSSSLSGDIDQAYAKNVAGYLTKEHGQAELNRHIGLVVDFCETAHLPQ